MKKKLPLIFLLLLLSNTLHAQLQKAHWYFANRAGVDFTSGAPVADTNGQIYTSSDGEGCTSISDEYGNLLFYSDGRRVYDRNHSIMPNGTGLMGHGSSSQSSIVLPQPDDCNRYYLFTIDACWLDSAAAFGLRYSVVDMSLNGGLGAVVATEKNILLPVAGGQNGAERLTAVVNANRDGYWVLTHYDTKFYAFEVTEAGVNFTPVVSEHSFDSNGDGSINDCSRGMLKTSSDGSKLVLSSGMGQSGGPRLAVYDFDTATGVVSNESVITSGREYYGVEFSPDGTLLYASIRYRLLAQYNLNAASVFDSEYIIGSAGAVGGLQLGTDGKIYIPNGDYLGRIEDPDTIYDPVGGEAPTYTPQAVHLAGRMARYGLPQFLNYYFRIAITVNGLSIREEQLYCTGTKLDFNFCSAGGIIESIHWDFGDGNTSDEMYPQYAYNTPGIYTISLTLIVDGEETTRTFQITISEAPEAYNARQEMCENPEQSHPFNLEESLSDINPENGEYTITFHLTEQEAENNENPLPATHTVTETTTVWVRIADENGCHTIRTLELIVHETAIFTVNQPGAVCPGDTAVLTVESEEELTVNWYSSASSATPIATGTTFETPVLTTTTTYWVETINENSCISERQEITITVLPEPAIYPESTNTICEGERVLLTATAAQGYDIRWFDDQNAEQWLATGTSFQAPELTQTTTYWVQAFHPQADCTSEKVPITIQVEPILQTHLAFSYNEVTCERFQNNFQPILPDDFTVGGIFTATPDGLQIDAQSGAVNLPRSLAGVYTITYQLPEEEFPCVSERQSSYVLTMELCIQKGISPNGDGINDYLDLSAFLPTSVQLFNRYGKMVYEHGQGYTNQWHGQDFNGQPLPEGTYFYSVRTLDREYSGYIYLSREVR